MEAPGQRERPFWAAALLRFLLLSVVAPASAQHRDDAPSTRVVELRYTPTRNAQIAIWLESTHGELLRTLGLTEAVALRGIGNRPGASQMNSGFRWPYGRREGVLPIWAHRRASAPGARAFRRVIFQDRTSEGRASQTSADQSRDDYFCLSFNNSRSRRDALDAVSCASVFNSDKGRYITQSDVQRGYAEPYESTRDRKGRMQPLSLESLYPPRHDLSGCSLGACLDHPDVADYDAHVHEVMPEIDAISMATAPGGEPQQRQFVLPASDSAQDYRVCLEINVEGDYNETWNDRAFPTPRTPGDSWDEYALEFGYPYRGQPSVVYCVPFDLRSASEATFGTSTPDGSVASWDTVAPGYGELAGMEGMTDDALHNPGSGADRLSARDGDRLQVVVRAANACDGNQPPGPIAQLSVATLQDELQAWRWAKLSFQAATDDRAVFRYEARVSTEPIVDDASFMRAEPAKSASEAADALLLPSDTAAGTAIEASFGGLLADTHYFVGIRAVDACAAAGPIAVAELTTPPRVFATVSPCFVATATYGSPLARQVGALRRFRDRYLASHAAGRGLIAAYWRLGPPIARQVARHAGLRVLSRRLLEPIVAWAQRLERQTGR